MTQQGGVLSLKEAHPLPPALLTPPHVSRETERQSTDQIRKELFKSTQGQSTEQNPFCTDGQLGLLNQHAMLMQLSLYKVHTQENGVI